MALSSHIPRILIKIYITLEQLVNIILLWKAKLGLPKMGLLWKITLVHFERETVVPCFIDWER